jgi:DNA polymerase-3 subunit beta
MLGKAWPAVAPSGSTPALQCFYFEVRESELLIAASNHECSVIVTEDVLSNDIFSFLVPAQRFLSIIKGCSTGMVQVSVSHNLLTVAAGVSVWEIKLPAVTFPELPKVKKPSVLISGPVLREAMKATRRSMSTSPYKPTLRMLDISKGKMTSCDGLRLTQASLGEDFPYDFTTAIPCAAADVVWSLIKDDSVKEVGLGVLDKQYLYQIPGASILAQKMVSRFPDVDQIMLRPAMENKLVLVVSRSGFLSAIDRVRINADTETEAIGLVLSAKSITVTSRDINGNGGTETIPSSWMGKDRTLIVNHKYLTTLLRSVDSPECKFFLGEDTRSRKSVLLLVDEDKGITGLVPQLVGNVRVW